jgi:predicted  nucleic acid-binding Zn-ribbon protein
MENKAKRRTALIMSLMLAFVFLWSCGGGGQQKVMEEQLQDAKDSATQSLNDLQKDLDDRIAYIDEQMETANEEVKEDLAAARAEFEEQKVLVSEELKNIEEAGLDTWDSVVAKTNELVADIKTARNEVSLKVRELLDGEE